MNWNGLKELENLRGAAPHHPTFDVADLYEIEGGENLDQHRINACDGTYLSDLGSGLIWWVDLIGLLEQESLERTDSEAFDAAELSKLWDNVVSLRAKISAQRPAVERAALKLSGAKLDALYRKTTDGDLDLLRRYHRLTRHLRAFARRLWPEIDLGWLWAQT